MTVAGLLPFTVTVGATVGEALAVDVVDVEVVVEVVDVVDVVDVLVEVGVLVDVVPPPVEPVVPVVLPDEPLEDPELVEGPPDPPVPEELPDEPPVVFAFAVPADTPARSESSCERVMHVSPLASETQSLSVCTSPTKMRWKTPTLA